MKKFFICSDIHGYYKELIESLKEAKFDSSNSNHVFVSCGDLLDRGKEPLECLRFVNSLPNKILIKGNHEDLMEEMLNRGYYQLHDLHNGTVQTISDIVDKHGFYSDNEFKEACEKVRTNEDYSTYVNSLVDYYETKNYVFVHGYIPCVEERKSGSFTTYNPDWRNAVEEDWEKSRWYPGWNLWEDNIKEPNKTIVCGHWHCSAPNYYVHHQGRNQYDITTPFVDEGIVCIDACTAHSHRVNCYVVEDEEL